MKLIKGHDDYFVTEDGRVLSAKSGEPKERRPSKHEKGYLQVILFASGKLITRKVHRLVALAYIPNPESKPQINHINGIKTDNRAANLEWVTAAENVQHAFATGLIGSGSSHPLAKPIIQMTLTGEFVAVHGSGMEARRAGFNDRHISDCINGRRATHKGFKWRRAE